MRLEPARFGADRRGAVSIIFATAAVPLAMAVGLAVDYSFYVQTRAQLNLAADSGAIHAVRIASSGFASGMSAADAGTAGATAGNQWFMAQLGNLAVAQATPDIPRVQYDANTSTFTSVVNYTATMKPHFGGLFQETTWSMTGTANAAITTNSYVEIDMLIDNSSSMLIGATPADIIALQNLTVCPPTAVSQATGHNGGYGEYSWNFPSNIGFGSGQTPPNRTNKGSGACDASFTGPQTAQSNECPYPPSLTGQVYTASGLPISGIAKPVDASGYCPAGTGLPDTSNNGANLDPTTGKTRNLPSAPCGFACHSDTSPFDYYNILLAARSKGASIALRFDVVQQAAKQVVQTMQAQQQVPNQFSLGVLTFNAGVARVHPAVGEADTNLTQGLADIQAITPPAVPDNPNTDFPDAMNYLATNFTASGNGSGPSKPRKNLFIITDGLEDYSPWNRYIGQMTSPLNETTCQPLKAMGFNIFVLYTPYTPLPNPFYLWQSNSRASVEAPITDAGLSVAAGLQACASSVSQYYQASSVTDINNALQNMLASALNTPGRLTY